MKGLLPTGAQSRSMWKTFDLACTPGITGSHLGQIERLLRGLDFIPEQWGATQGLWVEAEVRGMEELLGKPSVE